MAKLRAELSGAIDGMTSDQLTCAPEGKWCTAEILEHLNLTYVGTIKNLERRLAEGQPCSADGRGKKRWARIAVTRFGYIPTGRKSPERARPRGMPAQQVASEIMKSLDSLDRVISECELRFAGHPAIAEHPILGPLTAQEWRGFHLAHGLHHVKQMQRARRPVTP